MLVPTLATLLGVEVKVAVAACMCAYVATGCVQTSLWAWRGSLPGREALVLCAATIPAAALAGFASPGR